MNTKDATKDSIIQKVRVVVNKIQANPAVTPALKSQLGISTHEGGTYPQHPIPPNELVAELLEGGNIELDWSRNGNAPGTQFGQSESRIKRIDRLHGLWTGNKMLSVKSFNPVNQRFRHFIKARKGSETSGASNIAVVNAGGVVPPVV
ncbi:MAG: hypothetical protein HW421_890 [Ignavibacteria bacterium]|nr:hypothetical protein [Ignavibacteria bacterium]